MTTQQLAAGIIEFSRNLTDYPAFVWSVNGFASFDEMIGFMKGLLLRPYWREYF